MQTFDELSKQLNLTSEQKIAIENYCKELIAELLESIKQDNVTNFDETIKSLSSP